MKAIKITKKETIMFNGEYISNGHWLYTKGYNTISDKSLQSLVDAGVHFSRHEHTQELLTGEESRDFDGARVIPEVMGDDCLIYPTSFLYETTSNEPDIYRLFKHTSGRVVAVPERYRPLWEGRPCYQQKDKPLNALRIGDDSDIVAVIMPARLPDLLGRVQDLAESIEEKEEGKV